MQKIKLTLLDPKSSTPMYQQLCDQIRRAIKMGEIKPDEPLMREVDIASALGVSRSVVRQAILQLVNENVLYRVPGKGTFIAKPSFEYDLLGFYNFKDEVERQGLEFSMHLESFIKKPIDLFNASLFRVSESDSLIEIDRTLLVNHLPVILEKTTIVESFVPGLDSEIVKDTAYLKIFQRYGLELKKAKKYIEPELADSYISEKLDIHSGMPVLKIDRYTYDSNNELIVRCEWNVRGDRCRNFINLDSYNI